MAASPQQEIIETSDGWRLNTWVLAPPDRPRATVVAGHAMMVDRRTMYRHNRPSLARSLCKSGFRVVVPDLRGHGESGPRPEDGGFWNYDDIVEDTSEIVGWVREKFPDERVFLLGHSLFAHTSLAGLVREPDLPVSGVVALAASIWNRRFEPSVFVWLLKRLVIEGVALSCRLNGYVAAKDFGFGTANEAGSYWRDTARFVRSNEWSGRDGVDYYEGLSGVECPVLHVLSSGDRLLARPRSARHLLEPMQKRRQLWLVSGEEWNLRLGGQLPGHMEMVTDRNCEPLWKDVCRWILQHSRS